MATPTPVAEPTSGAAGGGASEERRIVETLDVNTLSHLRKIYSAHGGMNESWRKDRITAFLNDVQHHPSDAITERLLAKEELTFDSWLSYMTSSHSAITSPPKSEDLTWPLSSYYISSSHNTYLSGNQLSSNSTTQTYTNVLLRGCRCVEIDVWDGDETDSESSISSSDEEAEKNRKEKNKKLKSRYGTVKNKLPNSLTSRFEKTSLGKKLDERGAKKEFAAAVAAPTPSSTTTTTTTGEKPATSTKAGGTHEAGVIEPRVLHGYTLTKDITFRDVCTAIRESAFTATDLPLIASLEVHCGPEQQAVMVNIMKDIWGDVLVTDTEDEITQLPAPDQLRGKILVKVKYAAPGSSPAEYDSADEDNALNKERKKKSPSKIIQDLSRMGVYCRGISFKSFSQPEASMPNHIFSLSEKKFLDHHEKSSQALWEHNKTYLMRTYPKGLRFTSSNLNPAPFWGGGAQVVALNWQQTDEGMMLNEGMFAGTGGYVLKPEGYRPDLTTHTAPNTIQFKTLNLAITFYAAQAIPIPPGDKSSKGFEPYIKVEIHVDASEGQRDRKIVSDGHEREGEYKAKTRTHKGCDNIDLGAEKLEFKGITGLVDELTFVRFTVRDDEIGKDDLAAWACVRLDRLGDGFRFVHLLDADGELTQGVVLVKVEKMLA